ncbi:hypothetical protein BD779DRAFT_1464751 [Infundibulicybe gibba]|nr:hypothetical protein BD779DRAFT_1464751 [Infundibulicybe gibba]
MINSRPPDTQSSQLKIAFTYDRRSEWLALGLSEEQCAEYEGDMTIEDIAAVLRQSGHVEMVGGVRALAKRLAAGPVDWDVVFNICEGYGGAGREAQAPALLEAFGINHTFSDAATLALCLDKGRTKMVIEHHGIPTAPFACVPPRAWSPASSAATAITSSPHRDALMAFPLFVKPSSVSTGLGISQTNKITNNEDLETVVNDLAQRYPTQSILIEKFLGGREFTVGIVGTGAAARVVGVRELVFLKFNPNHPIDPNLPYDTYDPALLEFDVYGHQLKKAWCPNPQHVDRDPASDPVLKAVADVALRAWNVLGCRDGGRIDIRHDVMGPNAIPNFIEVSFDFI